MGDKPETITGGCMCGAVRYEANEPPIEAGTCHCRMCQRATGSAFWAGAAFPRSAFRFTKGEPKRYQSSSIAERSFCPDCGSPVVSRYLVPVRTSMHPDMVWVHIGTLDKPEAASIDSHYGVESQLPWVHFDDGLPRTRCDEDPELAAAFAAAEAGEE